MADDAWIPPVAGEAGFIPGRRHCFICGHWRNAMDFPTDHPWVTGVRRACEVCKRPKGRASDRSLTPEQLAERRRLRRGHDPLLPAKPLQDLIELRLSQGATKASLAARLELDPRAIRALKHQRFVRLDKADRWAIKLGADLSELYP